jgi:hypothetical protein
VPTSLEREGNFSQLVGPTGLTIPIYPPKTNVPYPNNTINTPLDSAAEGLLQYLPEPNLQGARGLNYRLLTTQGTHTNTLGATYTHTFGKLPAPQSPTVGQTPVTEGATQSLNVNFNLGIVATVVVNLFPELGGKQQVQGCSLSAAYTATKGGRVTNISVSSTRSNSQVHNFFSNAEDIASKLRIFASRPSVPINSNPANYGLPNLVLNNFSGFSETLPNSQLTQTFNVSGANSWTYRSHILRFGADIHRIEYNLFGGPNATGTFIFTGGYTQIEGGATNNPVSPTGSSFADFLLSLPQETTLESPHQKAYTRQTNWEIFARDDWRIRRDLTICAGLRYDYFSPFVERNNHLSTLDHWFNTAAFSTVFAPGQVFGNASRYSISDPGTDSVNLSLSKLFAFKESQSLEVRATATNAFNIVQFSGVNTQISSSAFGQVDAVQPMRQLTFMARFMF